MDADAAVSTIITPAAPPSMAPSFDGGPASTSSTGVILGINRLAIDHGGAGSSLSTTGVGGATPPVNTMEGTDSVVSATSRSPSHTPSRSRSRSRSPSHTRSRSKDGSTSEEGLCENSNGRRRAGSSSAGSRPSRDRSLSDHSSSSGRSVRRRRSGASRSRRDRDRSRDEGGRHQHSGGSASSLSPRPDRGGAGGGGGDGASSPRRRRERGDRGEVLEPSKVLHVRNVGYRVNQADLVSLLSCFGPVEKIKMFSGQALVQLPSVSVAKATMRHYEEDEEPKIGPKRVYLNYSRSRSIESRDGDSLSLKVGSGIPMFDSNPTPSSVVGGGPSNPVGELNLAHVMGVARGIDGAGAGNQETPSPSPYAHLIMEDHAKLLGLATCYLRNYGIPGGEGAILNINQREEMAERNRQAIATAMALNGVNGHVHHAAGGMAGGIGWSGMSGGVNNGIFSTGYNPRARSGARAQNGDGSDRYRDGRGNGARGGPSQR